MSRSTLDELNILLNQARAQGLEQAARTIQILISRCPDGAAFALGLATDAEILAEVELAGAHGLGFQDFEWLAITRGWDSDALGRRVARLWFDGEISMNQVRRFVLPQGASK